MNSPETTRPWPEWCSARSRHLMMYLPARADSNSWSTTLKPHRHKARRPRDRHDWTAIAATPVLRFLDAIALPATPAGCSGYIGCRTAPAHWAPGPCLTSCCSVDLGHRLGWRSQTGHDHLKPSRSLPTLFTLKPAATSVCCGLPLGDRLLSKSSPSCATSSLP